MKKPGPSLRSIWTPEEDERLKTLFESGCSAVLVAAKMERTAAAVRARAYLLKISRDRDGEEMTFANHRERQFMQYLRGASWIKAAALPPSEILLGNLLRKGWIEREQQGPKNEIFVRLTEKGLNAKRSIVPIAKAKGK
jgi:hypothetical protein